jgi:hypothetical protein
LLLLFFFLGNCWHDTGVTMAAAYTRCPLTSTERNTGFDVLSCSSPHADVAVITSVVALAD